MADETADDKAIGSLLDRLKDSGEQALNNFSQRLLENPTFLTALRRSIEAKERVGKTISGTMDFVNLPSKNDMAAIRDALDRLEMRVSGQQRTLAAIQQRLEELNATLAARKAD